MADATDGDCKEKDDAENEGVVDDSSQDDAGYTSKWSKVGYRMASSDEADDGDLRAVWETRGAFACFGTLKLVKTGTFEEDDRFA